MSNLTLKLFHSASEISKDTWNSLVPTDAPPVCRWEWLHALEASGSAVKDKGWDAHHLALWDKNELVAVAPAWLKYHSMGEYIYDFAWAQAAQQRGINYYPKFLIGLPLSPVTAPRILVKKGLDEGHIKRQLLAQATELARELGCSGVHFLFPPESELAQIERSEFIERSTMQFHWKNENYTSFEDYLSRFDSKRRNQLKRESSAPAKQGVTIFTVRDGQVNSTHAELAWKFYEATSHRHSWGPTQLTRGFFLKLFELMPEAVELVLAQKEGQVIAGAFNLASPTKLWGRYWGCFAEVPFLHFNVCLYHSIKENIERGRLVFEPGAGGEHKISRGFVPTQIHSLHRLFDAKLHRAVADFCKREMAHTEAVTSEGREIAGMKMV
jgi:uncharacterized protein